MAVFSWVDGTRLRPAASVPVDKPAEVDETLEWAGVELRVKKADLVDVVTAAMAAAMAAGAGAAGAEGAEGAD